MYDNTTKLYLVNIGYVELSQVNIQRMFQNATFAFTPNIINLCVSMTIVHFGNKKFFKHEFSES